MKGLLCESAESASENDIWRIIISLDDFGCGVLILDPQRGLLIPDTPWDWHICLHWGGLGVNVRIYAIHGVSGNY